MLKYLASLFYLFILTSAVQSQALLLEKDQNSFTFEVGFAGGHNFSSLGLGIGATYQSTLDLGAGVSRAFHKFDNYWILGQGASVKLLSETSADNITSSLSLNQGFSFSQGIKILSLGGGFSLKSKLERDISVLFSFGYNRIMSLSPDNEGFNSVTISLTLALGDTRSFIQLTPFAILAEDNRSTYGLIFGHSSIATEQW